MKPAIDFCCFSLVTIALWIAHLKCNVQLIWRMCAMCIHAFLISYVFIIEFLLMLLLRVVMFWFILFESCRQASERTIERASGWTGGWLCTHTSWCLQDHLYNMIEGQTRIQNKKKTVRNTSKARDKNETYLFAILLHDQQLASVKDLCGDCACLVLFFVKLCTYVCIFWKRKKVV